MKCILCNIELKRTLCRTCRDFLRWKHPGVNPDALAESYAEQEASQ